MGKFSLRFGFAVFTLVGAASIATGCVLFAPSEEEVREEFNDYVSGANSCSTVDDCAYASAGCPLGCQVAVRKDRVVDVERKARELIDDYETGGRNCEYECVQALGVECSGGRCRDSTTAR